MVQELYRIQWKTQAGNWRYLTGEILLKVVKDGEFQDAELQKEKPYLFTGIQTAERIARALTDLPEVAKVELREERTIIELKGAGAQ